MTAGIRTYTDNGTKLLDITDRVGRALGSVSTGKFNGYVEHPQFATGTPWWFIQGANGGAFAYQPAISVQTVNGVQRIVWTWNNSGSNANNPCTIRYGVY